MPTGLDSELDQLVKDGQALFGSWSELLWFPFAWMGMGKGGTRSRYVSVEFSTPPASVSRSLDPSPLVIGIARAGFAPEEIPTAALTVEPGVLPAGASAFRLTVDARKLSGLPGGTYWGSVTPRDSANQVHGYAPVPVWLVIP